MDMFQVIFHSHVVTKILKSEPDLSKNVSEINYFNLSPDKKIIRKPKVARNLHNQVRQQCQMLDLQALLLCLRLGSNCTTLLVQQFCFFPATSLFLLNKAKIYNTLHQQCFDHSLDIHYAVPTTRPLKNSIENDSNTYRLLTQYWY